MVTTQMKTDAQRLGNGKKAFNVKQVEKMMEDAGGSYTAGDGIVIADNEISIDEQIVAMKSEIVKDFVLADSTQHLYAQFWDSTNKKTLTDLFIFYGNANYGYVTSQVFIPKGYEGKLIRINRLSNDDTAITISATIKLEDVLKDVFPGNSINTEEFGFRKDTLAYYTKSGLVNVNSDIRIYYRPIA